MDIKFIKVLCQNSDLNFHNYQ